jgi:hypothetical protein
MTMDDRSKRGPADRARINVNEDYELRYWCEALDLTPEQLRIAVAKVGVMAEDVRRLVGR